MRPTLLFILLFFGCAIGNAQVTITDDDMPQIGESFLNVQAFEIDYEDPALTSGTDVYWDFSGLTAASDELITFIGVSDVPFAFQFVYNNPGSESYANLALQVNDFGVGVEVPVTEGHGFFLVAEDGFYDCGVAGNLNGFPIIGNREPTDRIFQLPLEFGMEADSSYSYLEIEIPELGHGNSHQHRENTLDAWGTVVTPEGTYEALRVRSVVNATDTIIAEAFEIFEVIVHPETVEYRWMAPGQGVPVLQINTIEGIITEISYRSDDIDIGVAEAPLVKEVTVYPNPARNLCTVNIPDTEIIHSANLVDLTGKTAPVEFEQNGQEIRLNVNQATPGLYRIVLSGDYTRFSNWLVIQK